MKRASILLCAILLGGCATYHPAPLPSGRDLLRASPATADLAARALPVHPHIPARLIDLGRPLSDADAGRLALIGSPDLAAARAQVGVAQAQLFAAGLLPDPQLSLALDRPAGIGLVDALAASTVLDLASLFTRSARVASARHGVGQTRLDVGWTEWLAFNHARLLVRRIDFLERQARTAAEAELTARNLYALTERAMQRGDARLDDVTLYQVGFLDARDRRLDFDRQAAAAHVELNTTIGLPPGARLSLAAAPVLHALPAESAQALAEAASGRRLDLLALRDGYSARESGLRAATRQALPLPQLSLNRARDTAGIWSRGLGLGLPLPLWNRGRGEIAVATATRSQLAAEYAARILQMRGDIAAALQDIASLDLERRALAEQLPTLERSAGVIAQATREGGLPLTTYETIRASLLDKRLRLLALEQAQSEAEVALETAAGRLLWGEMQ